MRLFLTILLMFAAISFGCAQKKKPPSYQGKSVRHWAIQAESEDPAKRREAAIALGKCGPEGLPALMKLVQDKERKVRAVATVAVMGMGPTAVPKLKELIHDWEDEPTQTVTIKALTQALVNMGTKGEEDLIELLKDPDPNVRFYAAKSFTLVDRKLVGMAIPLLKKKANSDPNPGVRRAAALTLAIIGQYRPPTFTAPQSEED